MIWHDESTFVVSFTIYVQPWLRKDHKSLQVYGWTPEPGVGETKNTTPKLPRTADIPRGLKWLQLSAQTVRETIIMGQQSPTSHGLLKFTELWHQLNPALVWRTIRQNLQNPCLQSSCKARPPCDKALPTGFTGFLEGFPECYTKSCMQRTDDHCTSTPGSSRRALTTPKHGSDTRLPGCKRSPSIALSFFCFLHNFLLYNLLWPLISAIRWTKTKCTILALPAAADTERIQSAALTDPFLGEETRSLQ